jgi:hypothetical protein
MESGPVEQRYTRKPMEKLPHGLLLWVRRQCDFGQPLSTLPRKFDHDPLGRGASATLSNLRVYQIRPSPVIGWGIQRN